MLKNNQLKSVLKLFFQFCQNWKPDVLFLCKRSRCYYYWNSFAAAALGGRQKTFRNLKVISSRWDHGAPSWICSWWRNASSSSSWGQAQLQGGVVAVLFHYLAANWRWQRSRQGQVLEVSSSLPANYMLSQTKSNNIALVLMRKTLP